MNEKAWLQYHQAFCFTLLYQCCAEWKTNLSMLVVIIDNALLKICFAVWLAHPRANSQSYHTNITKIATFVIIFEGTRIG